MQRPTDVEAVGGVRMRSERGRDATAPDILCRLRAAYRLQVNRLPPAPGYAASSTRARAFGVVAVVASGAAASARPSRCRLRQATSAAPAPDSTMKPIAARNAGDVGEEAELPAMTYAAVFGMEPSPVASRNGG